VSRLRQLTRAAAVLALAAVLLSPATALLSPATALAATGRASLTDIENDVMCVACHESLAVAQSPEAYSERQYIRQLISQGLTKKQIENQLVSQYGPAVLGQPPAKGVNLLVYIVPPVLVAGGILTLAITLPKWRRRARSAASAQPHSSKPLDPADAARLDEDLARQS
jgi:cytochrome c-type biogenesis protein CcmH